MSTRYYAINPNEIRPPSNALLLRDRSKMRQRCGFHYSANTDTKELHATLNYLHIQFQIDQFADRIRLLSEASAALEERGTVAVTDADWVELYRTLVELYDAAVDGIDPLVIGPLMVRLGLKVTMLEVFVERQIRNPNSRFLH